MPRSKNHYPKPAEESICWNCAKADGGCAWSDRFEPVDGWDADAREICWSKTGRTSTFCVHRCPEFEYEFRHEYTTLDDEGVLSLCRRVLGYAGNDYIDATEDLYELWDVPRSAKTKEAIARAESDRSLIETFFRGGNIFTELLCLDGDALIETLQKKAARYERCGEWR